MKIPFFSRKSVSQNQTQFPVQVEVKSAYNALMPEFSLFRGAGGGVFGYQTMSLDTIVENFNKIHPVNTAVMRIANAVADLPIQLVRRKTKEEDTDHPAFKLLCNPNMETEKIKFEYLQSLVVNYILMGNAYIILTGMRQSEPLELYSGNPLYASYETSPTTGYLSQVRFDYDSGRTAAIFDKSPDGFFYTATKLQQMYAIHNFSSSYSSSDAVGRSELESVIPQISLYAAATSHSSSLLQNGARPSGIFTVTAQNGSPVLLSEASFNRLQEQIKENYTGAVNAGRPILLEGGLEFKPIEMTPRDMDFDNMTERAEDGIYNTLAVPTQLVKPVKTTANNMTNIRKEFYENRVLPLGDIFCEHLTNALLPRYKQGQKTARDLYKFQINRDEIDVLIDERIRKREAIERSLILTIDEKRKIYNYAPVPAGDKIVDPNGRPIAGNDALFVIGANGTVSSENPDLRSGKPDLQSDKPDPQESTVGATSGVASSAPSQASDVSPSVDSDED